MSISPDFQKLSGKAAFFTLGCKLNFAETSTIARQLKEIGFESCSKGEQADLCLIHTCSVTELADKKSRQIIRKVIREHPNAFVVVAGCYAQLKPKEVSQIEGVDLIVSADHKFHLPDLLQNIKEKKEVPLLCHTPSEDIKQFFPAAEQGNRSRFFLKVQDGCDYYCSYCTVPIARGRSRNPSIESLVMQAQEAVDQGTKEIVLTGVNIGDFGKTTGETFLSLLQGLDQVEGEVRYRISSIEPNLLTDQVIAFVAQSNKFVPHFHIPLQSGSDQVLALMKRRYNSALFSQRVSTIKSLMPDAFIGVDVIIGMRGETDAYFEEASLFLQKLNISQLHVFPYSERPGTKALEIEYQVSADEKSRRSKILLSLSDQKTKDFYLSQIGKKMDVLVEHSSSKKRLLGFTPNYIKVELPYQEDWEDKILSVVLGEYNSDHTALKGRVVS